MFSATTRDELARLAPPSECCGLAELSAFARMAGRFVGKPGPGGLRFEMATENAACARKVVTMMKELLDMRVSVEVLRRRGPKSANLYVAWLAFDDRAGEALARAGVLSDRGGGGTGGCVARPSLRRGVPWRIVARKCCRRAYLRGAFLARGYVQNPDRAYHMEFGADCDTLARGVARLARSFGTAARVSVRKRGRVVYVKGGDDVVQLLRVIGAHGAVIALESVRVMRGLRGEVNRVVNCDTANLSKAVDAGLAQVEAIRRLQSHGGLESLPPGLQEIARLRLEHPEATLKEIGEMSAPPITKSAANHRMRRLVLLAGEAGEHRAGA